MSEDLERGNKNQRGHYRGGEKPLVMKKPESKRGQGLYFPRGITLFPGYRGGSPFKKRS